MSSNSPSNGYDRGAQESIAQNDPTGSPSRSYARESGVETENNGINGEAGTSFYVSGHGSNNHDLASYDGRSPSRGRFNGHGAGSPVGSTPPTPSSDFSPPRSFAGSIPRTPASMGRSLPGTPRTPFTPMDMQVMLADLTSEFMFFSASCVCVCHRGRPSGVAKGSCTKVFEFSKRSNLCCCCTCFMFLGLLLDVDIPV